jgi:hypothetical protein
MKVLRYEEDLQPVAEVAQFRASLDNVLAEAKVCAAQGAYERARELMLKYVPHRPDDEGALGLLAELDARTGRGVARLERLLRGLLVKGQARQVEATLAPLWDCFEVGAFSEPFRCKLVDHLDNPRRVRAILESLASGSGRGAIDARQRLTLQSDNGRAVAAELQPVERLAASTPRVLTAALVSASREGLQVQVNGAANLVAFHQVRGVHAGLVAEGGGRALWVDIVVELGGGQQTTLRLSVTDPAVPSLMPSKPVHQAWQEFIAAVRRAAGVQAREPVWVELPSLQALTTRWASTVRST